MQATAAAWQIYQATKDPLALGLIGLAEALPFLAISLWVGHLADRHDKRRIMVGAKVGFLVCAVGYWLTSIQINPPLIFWYLIIGLSGFCTSFDNISSIAYAQLLVPKDRFPRAAAWNLAMFQFAVVAGPPLAGLLLARLSAGVVFATAFVMFVISLILAAQLSPLHVTYSENNESVLARMAAGLRFIRSQPIIMGAMVLDMVAVLFGDAVALFPIFADHLNGGAFGFGILRASPGVGSWLLSMLQATRPFIRPTWHALRTTVTVFGLSMIAFAFAPSMPLAVACLAIGGMADGVSVIIRQSIYQAYTPDHLRGRVAAVSGISISTSNEIGAFESGLAARVFGVVPSVVIGGSITLLSVFAMGRLFKIKDSCTNEKSA